MRDNRPVYVQRPVSQNEMQRARTNGNRRPQTCFTGGGAGHTSAQCPSFGGRAHVHMINSNSGRDNYPTYTDQYVDDITDDLQHTFVFMISEQSTLTFPFGDRRALVSIDSNCSRHMTGFYTLHNPTNCHVIVDGAFAQGKSGKATYSGTMQLGNIFFDDTLFVDGIRETIISLGQLDQQGCRIESSRGVMKVYGPDGTFMFSAFLHNGRYFLDTQFYYGPNILKQVSNGGSVSAFAVSDARHDNSAELWHCRLGHVNYPDMKRLTRLATGVQIAAKHKLSFCEPCIMAKLKNHPLQNRGEKPSRPKQVFGADVTEVPERTETYVSDHGGETIMSLEFQKFLSDKGIFWQTAPRHTPNFNGLVERNIQTKQAIQRALHIQSGLTWGYWPLTSSAARMILNRLPRSSNPGGITPYEAYFRRMPDLSSFRVFGCMAYYWLDPQITSLPSHLSSNVEYSGTGSLSLSRAARGIFVGYDEHRCVYRILPDGASHYIVARVVIFDEVPIIRRMLSRCLKSEQQESSDDENYTHDAPASDNRPRNPPSSVQHQFASPRRADVDADMASPKDSYTPRQVLLSSKGSQILDLQ